MMKNKENVIFFKSLLKSPLKTGAFFPSSKHLAISIANFVSIPKEDEYIIELGAGTGRVTEAILLRGVPESQLVVFEMQPSLVKFLRKKFPNTIVIEGNAADMEILLPNHIVGKVSTVVSGIPMVNLRFHEQQAIVKSCQNIMQSDGALLQFTYRPGSPLPSSRLGLRQRYLGHVFMNMPPAAIWQYTSSQQIMQKPTLKDRFQFRRVKRW